MSKLILRHRSELQYERRPLSLPGRWDTSLVRSSGKRPRKKRKQQPRPSELGGRSPMVPTYSPLTPEGQIEGMGRFADGLKRIITNWRRKR